MTLRPLSSIDSTAIGPTVDLRGWRVIDRNGVLLGFVAELIVDVEDGSPVYINMAPARDSTSATSDECWIRIPYRHTSLDEGARLVVLNDVATLGLGTARAGLAISVD